MALKDLVASKGSLAEDVIEKIVSDFVRFDADNKEIVFTPASADLSNKARLLIYLVSLQGWPFVLDEVVPLDAKPAELEERLNIAGGTLRPLLKELKDRNIISEKSGRYSVRAVALHAIQRELEGSGDRVASRPKRKGRNSTPPDDGDEGKDTSRSTTKKKTRSAAATGLGERFQAWIDEGYFDKARTLSDLQQRFHKEAILVPQTSLPGYLLKAVRSRQLSREKEDVQGKLVWTYRKAKK